jgi:hypothetical protein
MELATEQTPEVRTVTVAHSPDSDDAFMFYGLATNKLETDGIKFEHSLKDIQTLNEDAKVGVYDVTAISFHAYAYVSDKYALLPHGASIGDKYGPIVVTKEPRDPSEIGEMTVAIPGELTSAFLALRLFNRDFKYIVVPFDEVIDAVQTGKADAGLLIHEGQLFYKQLGLDKVLDLGEWWHERTGLPILWWQTPLGVPSDTPGGTAKKYRDNRVKYFFEHPGELVSAGGFGMDFGTGAPNQTDVTTDDGQFASAVTKYYGAPASISSP